MRTSFKNLNLHYFEADSNARLDHIWSQVNFTVAFAELIDGFLLKTYLFTF